MKITSIKNAEFNPNPHGIEVKKMYDKDSAVVMYMTLQAGKKLKQHTTPVDVFFFIIEGKPTIEVGEEKIMVEKDSLVESPANIMHCIYNETTEIVRLLVVKAPKPITASKF